MSIGTERCCHQAELQVKLETVLPTPRQLPVQPTAENEALTLSMLTAICELTV
jgi:hypothetical protein